MSKARSCRHPRYVWLANVVKWCPECGAVSGYSPSMEGKWLKPKKEKP